MDVTKRNFHHAYAHLAQLIDSADFISIDSEFTGLGPDRPSALDTPNLRYAAARTHSIDYPPIQFGLVLFRQRLHPSSDDDHVHVQDGDDSHSLPNESQKNVDIQKLNINHDNNAHNDAHSAQSEHAKVPMDTQPEETPDEEEEDCEKTPPVWEMIPFNFALCPQAIYPKAHSKYPIRDRVMHLQSSALHFLLSHGFDFQKCFMEGISWMKPCDEASVRTELQAGYRASSRLYVHSNSERDDIVAEKFRKTVAEWVKDKNTKVGSRISLSQLNWDRCHKATLIGIVEKHFPNVSIYCAKAVHALDMPATFRLELKSSRKKAQSHMLDIHKKEYYKQVERNMSDSIGFRKVIDLLLEKKKPLIFHHGLLDMTKLLANFINPLPESLSAFKRQLNAHFPVLIDTRVLLAHTAKNHIWLNNHLVTEAGRGIGGIIQELRNPSHAKIVPRLSLRFYDDPDFRRYSDEENQHQQPHEAGYDALQTGRLLLYLMGMEKNRPITREDFCDIEKSESFAGIMNRIYLGSCGGFFDIDINSTVNPDNSNGKSTLEEELGVEMKRNPWMNRSDVLVVSGIKWEEENRTEAWDVPFRVYDKVIGELLRHTPYDERSTTKMPCISGTCVFIPKRSRQRTQVSHMVAERAKKKQKTENGNNNNSISDTPNAETPTATAGGYDVTPMEGAEEEGMSKEDLAKIEKAAKERGLTIMHYKDAVKITDKPRRIRFSV